MLRDDKLEKKEWPSVGELLAYRDQVKEVVNKIISSISLEDNSIILDTHPFWIVIMGIEHEKIHLETSSALIR